MGFFWDPKSHIANPGIFVIFVPKKSQIKNPGIFWDFWDWDFLSNGIPKIPNYTIKNYTLGLGLVIRSQICVGTLLLLFIFRAVLEVNSRQNRGPPNLILKINIFEANGRMLGLARGKTLRLRGCDSPAPPPHPDLNI